MRTLLTLTILILTVLGCSTKQTPKDEKLTVTETQVPRDSLFREVANFPIISDTAKFINDLRQTFSLDVNENPFRSEDEKITTFKKVKIYGSDKDYFFIEYDWTDDAPMCEFPWKCQLLLTTDGKLVKIFDGQRFDFVTIFPNQHPFLLIVIATAKGNGVHEIYKITADTVEDVYEGDDVQTYDAEQDLSVFEPSELKINFVDENRDGFNDIVFTGQKLMLGKYTKDSVWYDVEDGKPFTVENPADRIPIKYIFLYDKKTGHFKAKENYTDER